MVFFILKLLEEQFQVIFMSYMQEYLDELVGSTTRRKILHQVRFIELVACSKLRVELPSEIWLPHGVIIIIFLL